jgi:ketosteroid isomerase-like protein
MKEGARILLGVLLLLGITGTAGKGAATNAEQEIRTLEQQMNDAYAKNDLQTYFSYYAQDFTQWLPEGRSDLDRYKRQWQAYIAAGNSVQAAEVRELLVRVAPSEDAAVASYILYVKTKGADGKMSEEESQETDVWFRREGGWKVVALHFAPLAKK